MQDTYPKELVGGGYEDFWHFTGRYRVVKGSRASKKSKTMALWLIYNMMRRPEANALVVRKVYRTLKDSCFTELKWAVHRLGATKGWDMKQSPLEMTYKPTGQKIYFRGLDDPIKITSITVEKGHLCWCWVEEAYEITQEEDFSMLDESIRGALPEGSGLFKQVTMTFNPWNERHWIKGRFFDGEKSPDALAITTNYQCNEWLDEADLRIFEDMKARNPRRYQVAGLGHWGIVDGLVYESWEEKVFDLDEVRALPGVKAAFGLDFGYTNDPSALFCGLVDGKSRTIWVFDELYQNGLTNRMLAERIRAMGYGKERIRADCAEPKSIQELRDYGLGHITACRKGPDSVNNGIQHIQNYHLLIHPRCSNFLTEISNYTWEEDGAGGRVNRPTDAFNHLMDAMRYALEDVLVGPVFSFS